MVSIANYQRSFRLLAVANQLRVELQSAFEPFRQYVQWLAQGKLDAYLDSVRSQDKVAVPGMVLSTEPKLLIHELGLPERVDMDRINCLFTHETMFVVLNVTNATITDFGTVQSRLQRLRF